ncbi:MAG: type I methionyl aminopeptidase [Candidatus Devosia phytovorans]|uniref:Methionine aminopeptidase n=1 Tax=Candidatus Devosia phytovorans TaxID=3121372 RepID=A0AAJ5VYM9_9HYPH|nr:type I methionyl aminopeptidase [Devosia sp.]WEK06285.1 MAG: type I methionyl aminopeptidase [Devosia sp.]
MTITTEEQLEKLKAIGRICAITREAMASAMRPGMTTLELDEIGAKLLAEHGAHSAPIVTYNFPGATCISVNEEIAHGIPGNRVLRDGDLVNIDVSAVKDGVFADCGSSHILGEGDQRLANLCRDGKKAMWAGINVVKAGAPLADIGHAIGKFAKKGGYTLIRNLASHGVGDSLHDEPGEISTWPDRGERRRMTNGLVFTIEPFLSLGGKMADQKSDDDEWTLISQPSAPTVQYEHTIVATPRGPVVVTLAA